MTSLMDAFDFKPSRMRESRVRESVVKPSRTKDSGKKVQFSAQEQPSLIRKHVEDFNFDLFTKLPPESEWLRNGTVERQTSIADAVWQPRVIVLTAEDVMFAKPDSDAVVDRLPLRNITFVGQVSIMNIQIYTMSR